MNNKIYQPIIFEQYPELVDRIPWVSLGLKQTSVERLQGFEYQNLWVKHDDVSSDHYGGNKIRKLEFALAEAVQKRKKRVITFGGIGTNHGLATVIYCKKLNLDCSIILYDQPLTLNVKRNLKRLHEYQADLIYSKSFFKALLDYYIIQRMLHPNSYFLYPGGSSVIGTLGFVNAAFELKKQIDRGDIPEPSCIFCPVGSNGTMAGLLLGCKLAGIDSTVVGVRVTMSQFGPFDVCNSKAVAKLAHSTYCYLKTQSGRIPDIHVPQAVMLNDYFGDGYGHPTAEGGIAYTLMRDIGGINLDPCYTSKAFAAVLDHCSAYPDSNRTVLFWNTYNSVELPTVDNSTNNKKVPSAVQKLLDIKETVSYPISNSSDL